MLFRDHYRCLWTVFSFALFPSLLLADTTGVTNEEIPALEKMIVTATRHQTLLRNAPSITHVISREEIEEIDAARTSDVLRYVAGLNVESGTGSGGPFKRNITIGGMPNYYNVVMVNGMRLRSSHIQTGVDIDLIPVSAIERIEIIKDASSALYGSDALGGVVNIITRKGSARTTAQISGLAGSNHTWGGEAIAGGASSSDAARYSMYAGYVQSDGPDILLPAHRIGHLDYRKTSLINRFDFTPSERLSITGCLNFLTDDAEFGDGKLIINDTTIVLPDSTETTWYQVTDEYDMLTARMFMPGIQARYQLSDNVTGHVQAYYTLWDAELSTEHDELASPRIGVDVSLPHHLLTAGTELLWRNYFRSGLPDTADQYTISAFLQDQITLLDTALVALLAVRFDYVVNTATNAENNGPVPSPKLSLLYRPISMLALRLTAGRAFKAPTIQELYEDRFHRSYYRLGNPALEPEYSTNIAVGCELTPLPVFHFTVNAYGNFLKNMIVVVPETALRNNRPVYGRYNLESGTIAGGDISGGVHFGNERAGVGVDLGVASVFQASDDDSLSIPYLPGTSLFARANGRICIVRHVDLLPFIGYNAALRREYWSYSDNTVTGLDDLHNLEAGMKLDFAGRVEAHFKVGNILGREHETYEDALMKMDGDHIIEGGVTMYLF